MSKKSPEEQAARDAAIRDEVEAFIAAHELHNPHYLRDREVVDAFPQYKPKHVRRALEELR